MNFGHRIRTIYVKELIDILRDRRTLIAMIVVPIVLYPLLMLGSIQALSVQTEELKEAEFVILTLDEKQSKVIRRWIEDDLAVARGIWEFNVRTGAIDPQEDTWEDAQPSVFRARIVLADSVEDIERYIQSRQAQLGLQLRLVDPRNEMAKQWQVLRIYDPEDIRSLAAAERFADILQRQEESIRLERLARMGVPPVVINPVNLDDRKVTTPGSILGLILPLILVLMTITGAIYPAIDLTAGERERGTLETLMVCPVRVVDLVVGKFLVVTTVAVMGAALNLASVSATVYFGGFQSVVNVAGDEGFPWAALPLILVSLVPFAILMSAIMIAVCSYARTFKEAQNYVTPVILAVLIPGGIAAFPATRLEGVMLVMPVGNMVLLTRELLMGSVLTPSTVAWVLLSTTLYATAAVAVASKVFGTESVVFSDTASLKTVFSRRLIRPADAPPLPTAALVVALLFPFWFYVQAGLQAREDMAAVLRNTGWAMPICFVLVPAIVCWYFRINLKRTFALRPPGGRYLLAAVVLGLTAWVPVRELTVLQMGIVDMPEALKATDEAMQRALGEMSPWLALLLLAVIPAVCEEALFRGFLLSGLRTVLGRFDSIVAAALVFALFHYFVYRVPVTMFLGIVLGFLCWQSRSIWPALLMHALHNGILVSMVTWPWLPGIPGMEEVDSTAHLPLHVVLPACLLFVIGVLLALRARPDLDTAT
jgi:ABC-2 type transport system permease protein/sodium transport system permease protein